MKEDIRAKIVMKSDVKVVDILKTNMYFLRLRIKRDETMHLILFWNYLQLGALTSLSYVGA